MNQILSALANRRFLRWVVLPHVIFFAAAWWTEARDIIAIENPVDIALSAAVCIAFAEAVMDAIWNDKPVSDASLMICGVFLGWYSNAIRSTWSMLWRAMGSPEWLANTDFTSYALFVLGWGAVLHLYAPDSIDGRAPRVRWIKIGAWFGVGIFAAISFAHRDEIVAMVQWLHPPHDRAGSPIERDIIEGGPPPPP